MRWLGKRMNGQLTIVELAIAGRGLIQGFVVLLCILLFLRGVNRIAFHKMHASRLNRKKIPELWKRTMDSCCGIIVNSICSQAQCMR